jgi:diacylglycerol kinase family enzyme
MDVGVVNEKSGTGGSWRRCFHDCTTAPRARLVTCAPSATTAITLTTRKPLPINTDGELTTYTPAEFSIRPMALQVYSPQR